MSNAPVIFARNEDVDPILVTSVGGLETSGEARLRKLLHGPGEYVLGPGDAVFHPIECKTPPEQTW